MQRIEQLKLELSKAIKESPEYIEYKRLEAIIDKDPNLKRSIDEFRRQNFVSGHACQEEIKLVYSLLKPKYAIPVHGEYRHLIAQKEVAMSLGYDKEDVIIAKSGDVIELSDEKAAIVGKVHTGAILVDGLGVGDVGNIVLRDRQNLAENGIIIVVLTLEKYTGQLVAGPDIVTRGFVYVREAEELLDEARAIVTDSVLRCLDKNITDWSKIKNIIKDDLSEYLWKKMKRNPVILPIIMEAQM